MIQELFSVFTWKLLRGKIMIYITHVGVCHGYLGQIMKQNCRVASMQVAFPILHYVTNHAFMHLNLSIIQLLYREMVVSITKIKNNLVDKTFKVDVMIIIQISKHQGHFNVSVLHKNALIAAQQKSSMSSKIIGIRTKLYETKR